VSDETGFLRLYRLARNPFRTRPVAEVILTRYTQAFEDMLRTHFFDFLELVEPGFIARLGVEGVLFSCPGELAHWPEEERRDLGLLTEVLTRRGEWQTILVQVEAEAGDPAPLEEKLL